MAIKPGMSSGALRLGVSLLGSVIAAVALALQGVEFDQLVQGGLAAWKHLGISLLLAAGGALFGWAKKFLTDIDIEQLPLEWRESVAPKAPESPTTTVE